MIQDEDGDESSLPLHPELFPLSPDQSSRSEAITNTSLGLGDLTTTHLLSSDTERGVSNSQTLLLSSTLDSTTPALNSQISPRPARKQFAESQKRHFWGAAYSEANDEVVHVEDIDADVNPAVDPDKCYTWLLPPDYQESDESLSSTSSCSSRLSLPLPPPPDGGWGWFVVLGAFIVSFICDGISYCYGVLYTELMVQFEDTKSKTSMVGSIFFGVAMILGPLSSALTTKFGCRTMTIFGGLLSSFGCLLSYFATSIEMLCITFSVVVGIGFSFCYITSVVIVAFYFDKRRALATGLAVCGTGVGTFTFAPLMDFLISEYGWRGFFLVMSGISLNLVVCGMLFRPLQFTEAQRCQLLLDEFNRICPGREELETAKCGRLSSSSSESDTDSSSGANEGCFRGLGRAFSRESSSSEEEGESDMGRRSLSMLTIPTFVHGTSLAHQRPSKVLLEALYSSKNPNLTLQRYMKNAYLQFEYAKLHAQRSRRHKSERASASSPVDPQMLMLHPMTHAYQTSGRHEAIKKLGLTKGKLNQGTNKDMAHQTHPHSVEAEMLNRPLKKPVYIIDQDEPADSYKDKTYLKNQVLVEHVSPILRKKQLKTLDHRREPLSKPTPKDHLHQHQSYLNPHLEVMSPVDASSRRLSNFFVGRHNALSIHLPLYRSDIFYRRAQQQQQVCTMGTSCPELPEPSSLSDKAGSCGCLRRNRICAKICTFWEEACHILRTMVECQLFCNPFFILFVVSNFIYYFWSDVPYMYAADYAVDEGYDRTSSSFFLSIIGIFNTIGQVFFGYIGDLDVNLLNVYAIVSALSGVFVGVIPLFTSYASMAASYAAFGFCTSVSFPLTTVLLVNYLGMERLTNAYGLLMLMQGIANLFGPPFAGWVSDNTGNYKDSFYMSGFFYALSGLVLFLAYLPGCSGYEPARSRRNSMVSSMVAAPESSAETSAVKEKLLHTEGSPV